MEYKVIEMSYVISCAENCRTKTSLVSPIITTPFYFLDRLQVNVSNITLLFPELSVLRYLVL